MRAAVPEQIERETGERTVGKITRRLIPFLFILYLIAYLDRVNISFASLEMTRSLAMSHEQFGFAAGIFFLGYVLLEVPGALIVEVWGARKTISRIMVTWGLLASATGLVVSAQQLYTVRFLLGLAEAGFFPGMLIYLSHWYRARDRAKAVAMFMIAVPASEIAGAPVSAFLMRIHWLNLPGWRWLLILEGIPAVVLGVVTLWYLTERPADARWLSDSERNWITRELEQDRAQHDPKHSARIWRGLTNKRVWLLMLAYFSLMNVWYSMVMWLPKILQAVASQSTFVTTLLTAIPFLIGAPVALWLGWRSDRKNERRWHAALPILLGAAALSMFPAASTSGFLAILLFAIAVIGAQSAKGPFWAIATTLLGGKAAAASIALINSLGNLGGFAGPYTVGWLASRTQGFAAGVWFITAALITTAGLILIAGRAAATGRESQ